MSFGEVWQFVVHKSAAAGVLLTAGLAVIGGGWALYRHFSKKRESPAYAGQSIHHGNGNIQVGPTSGTVSITAGVEVDVDRIVGRLVEEARERGAAASQLEDAVQREQDLQDQIRQLTETVEALQAQRGKADAPSGIEEALQLLTTGETEAAESIFQAVKERRKAEGGEAFKEAAAAARHIGALTFLHDTQKALAAYREAVELDPDNADGWNRLGHVLRRSGDLDGAIRAYERVLSLGNISADQGLIAAATGNLGLIYRTRGDLDRAEVMHKKSLEIEEALGRKEGMANQYSNLGGIYRTRGELDRAEEMYRRALALFTEIGAKPRIVQTEQNLAALREKV